MARVVEALAKAGNTDEALEAARKIEDANYRSYRSPAMVRVVEALAKAGKTDAARQAANEALESAHKIEDADGRSLAIASVVETLAKAGKTDEALELARKIKDADDRSLAMVRVAEVMTKNREVGRAKNVLDEAERAAQQVTTDEGKSARLADVAIGLSKLHFYKLARETVDRCSSSDKLAAYTAILREYHIEHHPDQAKLFEKEEQKPD
jgi:hypothetical protein